MTSVGFSMTWLPADPRRRRLWLGILGLALSLRVGAACIEQHLLETRWHRQFLVPGDAEGYWDLAKAIASGQDYAVHYPPRYVHRMPGFPALLAVSIKLFGESLFPARLMLAVVGTLACALVYCLGRQIVNERVGLLAAGLAAVSPVFAIFSVIELSETAFAAALLLNLILVDRLHKSLDQESTSRGGLIVQSLLSGAAVALGSYFHPSWILAAPLLSALLVLCSSRRRGAIVSGGILLLGTFLTLLPWGIRNEEVCGHFVLTTLWMGASLYDGLNPAATGSSDMRFFDEDRLSAQMTEFEVDQHYRHKSWEFVRDNPGQTLKLAGAKTWRFWKPWPSAEQFGNVWVSTGIGAYFSVMLAAAVWGILVIFGRPAFAGNGGLTSPARRGPQSAGNGLLSECVPGRSTLALQRIWSVAILAGPILYFAVLHTVFVSSLRYRLPAEYPMLVLSAFGLLDAWSRLRSTSADRSAPRSEH